jgi:hypothetical protein
MREARESDMDRADEMKPKQPKGSDEAQSADNAAKYSPAT